MGQNEAYRLIVTSREVALTANTPHGISNGLQTLYQLLVRENRAQGCDITDDPPYRWRGYMGDVGRNYHSVSQFKQQNDVMAKYKMNDFPFHLTSNVVRNIKRSN